jgi:hypothetical protein
MKKVVFSFMVLVAVLATACNNQSSNSSSGDSSGGDREGGRGNFNAEEMVDRQMSQMKETLDLSGKQEKQMRAIIMDGFDEMQKMREQAGDNREGMREQMQKMREEQNVKIKAILSEEQLEKYNTYEEERRGRRGQGRPQ